jgi:hypothetical protein
MWRAVLLLALLAASACAAGGNEAPAATAQQMRATAASKRCASALPHASAFGARRSLRLLRLPRGAARCAAHRAPNARHARRAPQAAQPRHAPCAPGLLHTARCTRAL